MRRENEQVGRFVYNRTANILRDTDGTLRLVWIFTGTDAFLSFFLSFFFSSSSLLLIAGLIDAVAAIFRDSRSRAVTVGVERA